MTAGCELNHLGKIKFDEYGRQRALDRLNVMDTPKEQPFERIIDLVKATLDAPICAVSLIDHDRQWFRAARGLEVEQTPRNIAFCDHAIRAEVPFVIEDALLDERFAQNPLVVGEPFIRSYLGIPLTLPDGYIVGTLCLIDHRPRAFDPHEIEILKNFANLVIGELELRTIAFTDGLTKLLSRKAWTTQVEEQIDRSNRRSDGLSIVLFDLDHFKTVNDRFGHDVGDQVLRMTAEGVSAMLRRNDLFGRVGGEEFAVCIMNASPEVGLAVAERIRLAIAGLAFPDHDGLSCSASFGVAMLKPGERLKQVLKRADDALYKAKRTGRNRVEFATGQSLVAAT